MTDNDYRIEDRFEKGRPNYTLRRLKFTLAVVGLVVSVTLMLTWHGGGVGPFISHCISRMHSHVFRRRTVRCGFESRRRRLAGPSTPPASPLRSAFLGLWERWACFFAVMAPSGPAHINQSHINQGQGRNR